MLLVLMTWMATLRANTFFKAQDALLAFHQRYTDLMKAQSLVTNKQEALGYYSQYWFLHHQEFSFWRQGLIPADTYLFWLRRRVDEWKSNPTIKGDLHGYQAWWRQIKGDFDGTHFVCFMTRLLEDGQSPEAVMADYAPRRRQVWLPGFFRPPDVKCTAHAPLTGVSVDNHAAAG